MHTALRACCSEWDERKAKSSNPSISRERPRLQGAPFLKTSRMPTVHGQPAKSLLHGCECRRLGLRLDKLGTKHDAFHNSVEHKLRSFLVHPRPLLLFRPMAAICING